MNDRDRELVERASEIIQRRFELGAHHVGAALRTTSGKVYAAVHLAAYLGCAEVCAEAVALGMAASDGDTDIDTIVAYHHHGLVVSPCGSCRELIYEYSPNARVIVPGESGEEIVSIASLLPNRYQRT